MFKPAHTASKIFAAYLKLGNHPAKVRLQNWMGRTFFRKGILLKNDSGVLFRLPANDWITRIMLMEGGYEAQSLQLASSILKNGGVFVDIGANFGLYSCTVSKACNHLKIIAVDPNYKIIPTLLQNITLNQAEAMISVFNTAIAGRATFVTLAQPAADNLGTTQTKTGSIGLLNIGSSTLQNLLQANNITNVTLVKIDIEGNEFSVFEHFEFEKFNIENILLEYNHLSPVPFTNLVSFFKGNGYKALDINGNLLHADSLISENNIWFKKG